MHFNSPKELLLHYGKIDAIKRGRISGANHAFIAERIADNDTVAGYESATSSKPTGAIVHSNAKATVSTEKIIADIGLPARDELAIEAYCFVGQTRKNVGMREVCSNCRASLTYCRCEQPYFRVDFDATTPVYFKDRTTLFKKGW